VALLDDFPATAIRYLTHRYADVEVRAVELEQIEGTQHGVMAAKAIAESVENREAALVDHDRRAAAGPTGRITLDPGSIATAEFHFDCWHAEKRLITFCGRMLPVGQGDRDPIPPGAGLTCDEARRICSQHRQATAAHSPTCASGTQPAASRLVSSGRD
jgi:hypothetical protein